MWFLVTFRYSLTYSNINKVKKGNKFIEKYTETQ